MRQPFLPSRIDGTLVAPPSKSVMIRVTAAALLAGNVRTRILNPSLCDDALSGVRVARGLGASVEVSPNEVTIEGGLDPQESLLDCGESGLCLRMFTAVAALCPGERTLTGRPRLLGRPTTAVAGPIQALGATCRTQNGHPPITVGGPLRGGSAIVDGALSSQFLSGLLLALPCAAEDSTLVAMNLASRPYVELTLELLRRFGVRIDREDEDRFIIPGGQLPKIGDHRVEGDWSAAACLLVLGAVGGRIRVTGLDPDSAQADRQVLDILTAAGARVRRLAEGAEVEHGALRAFEFDATNAPDLVPPLAALACHCEGTSVFTGVRRLKYKESSRAEIVAREFSGLGVRVDAGEDTLSIRGGPIQGGSARSHGDHRIAMALAAAAVAARGPVAIDGVEHVTKSYPRFLEDLAAVRNG
ncbi:MAG: 3-phosphoshikimate 1-carboxyvinyltransferase [Planctomycetota bacterium]|jgi:3-phosphoshikimate 1-carboxyvinyltransferase